MAATKPKRSPLTPSTVTPPSLNRQNSHNATPNTSPSTSYASAALANLRTRSMSPSRFSFRTTPSPATSPRIHPQPSSSQQPERRTSWEDCARQRDGYISFPDFDLLRAQRATGFADRQ
ncbi:hypothetical protein B0A50_03365 [Salinomyces thailandicus]|uniref:Uncharacterized protein n=1 Tax=Salinomyces thailandicus TaxID=706561 RepID=A0A4U0U2G9_9PEZI|nr:hypothetical protein B0A50_03365 [Salinomyces thailandica]